MNSSVTTILQRRRFLQCLAAGACLPLAAQQPYEHAGAVHRGNIQPWFHPAALGLFIHWGPCSVGEIEIGWGMFKDINAPNPYWPPEKYRALADRFDPRNYDPNKWLAAAAKAGFKYAVVITRHCDGYAMWPSDFGDFGTKQKMKGRDLVRPFVEACREHGLKVGFYYCPTDWTYCPKGWPYAGFPRRDPNFNSYNPLKKMGIPIHVDMPQAELQRYFEQYYAYVKGQVTELLTRYGKIDLLWWDGYDWPNEVDLHGLEMEEYVRKLQPEIIQNDRYVSWRGKKSQGDYNTDLEAKDPAGRPPGDWEQCEQICVGWSYRGPKATCKPASYLIERLARDRAWGGNYLPDFGPLPDGTMPPSYYAICAEMAEWMKHSAVSIYNVDGGPYPDRSDCPITVKGDTWFVHFLTPSQRSATLKNVGSPKSATLLRTGKAVLWNKEGDDIVLVPAQSDFTSLDDVVRVVW
ncbi:MAG: alpha-L-fucosidase [Acidobacteriota bacterium]|nr:alpha-L-fucosidase [Acidobacteriota bacterium]